MNKWFEILLGLILIVIPVIVVTAVPLFLSWSVAAVELVKGGVVVGLVCLGLLFLIIGISDLKD